VTIKLVDFGIAKALTRRTKTTTGHIKGKMAYLSPEQCRGDEMDARSDVFALGIVLFELTTGTRLYGKLDDFAIMNRLAMGELPAPSSRRPAYPEALEHVVLKAMSRDPETRYASAQALAIDLEVFAREQKLDVSNRSLAELLRSLHTEPAAPPEPTEPSVETRKENAPRLAEARVDAEPTRGSLSKSVSHRGARGSRTRWLVYASMALGGAGATLLWNRLQLDARPAPETSSPSVAGAAPFPSASTHGSDRLSEPGGVQPINVEPAASSTAVPTATADASVAPPPASARPAAAPRPRPQPPAPATGTPQPTGTAKTTHNELL
jgi:serine/threonine-protein kinase